MKIYGDEYFMKLAIQEAQKAAELGEVPVGAVIVAGDQLLARCHNSTEMLNDVTAHAEILSITAASQYLGSKYLMDCTLYVTLEPCLMCSGALYWSKIGRVLYGADDEKNGYKKTTGENSPYHPKTTVVCGILKEECALLMKQFFKAKR